MANRKRDVQILLWVTPEEKKMIRKRMILSKTSNMSVYLRKMAIDGMIVNADTPNNLPPDISLPLFSYLSLDLHPLSQINSWLFSFIKISIYFQLLYQQCVLLDSG